MIHIAHVCLLITEKYFLTNYFPTKKIIDLHGKHIYGSSMLYIYVKHAQGKGNVQFDDANVYAAIFFIFFCIIYIILYI